LALPAQLRVLLHLAAHFHRLTAGTADYRAGTLRPTAGAFCTSPPSPVAPPTTTLARFAHQRVIYTSLPTTAGYPLPPPTSTLARFDPQRVLFAPRCPLPPAHRWHRRLQRWHAPPNCGCFLHLAAHFRRLTAGTANYHVGTLRPSAGDLHLAAHYRRLSAATADLHVGTL